MKPILVLVDFTDTSLIAVNQAIALAKIKNSSVFLCHITSGKVSEELKQNADDYVLKVQQAGLQGDMIWGEGDLYQEAPKIIASTDPDLMVVGTHGKKGIKQNLFGSNIYKLAQSIKAPTLVVNDLSPVSESGFHRIVLPVAPHPDYLKKVEDSTRVLAEGGSIVLLAIMKPGVEMSEKIEKNVESSKKMLKERGIEFEYKEVESNMFSVGYAKETLSLLDDLNADLIGIMTRVSEDGALYGKMDKENLLLNVQGVPVLCSNH